MWDWVTFSSGVLTCSRVVWKSERSTGKSHWKWTVDMHDWILSWMLSLHSGFTLWGCLHSGFTMDYWQCWGFILDLYKSGTMVSEFGSGQSALFLVYDSGWCNLWAYYIYDNTGWADRLIHSDLLPGSNARWCVENCPLVSRLWPSLPGTVTLTCQVLVTNLSLSSSRDCDRWPFNNKTVGSFWC